MADCLRSAYRLVLMDAACRNIGTLRAASVFNVTVGTMRHARYQRNHSDMCTIGHNFSGSARHRRQAALEVDRYNRERG